MPYTHEWVDMAPVALRHFCITFSEAFLHYLTLHSVSILMACSFAIAFIIIKHYIRYLCLVSYCPCS